MNSNKGLPFTLEGPEDENTDFDHDRLTDFESFVLRCVSVVCAVGLAGVLALVYLVYLAIRWVVS